MDDYFVAMESLHGVTVSTVFEDERWNTLFEFEQLPYQTSITWSEASIIVVRYETREEALEGHCRVIRELRKFVEGERL